MGVYQKQLEEFISLIESGKYDDNGFLEEAVENYGKHVNKICFYKQNETLKIRVEVRPVDKKINNLNVEKINQGDAVFCEIKRKGERYDEYLHMNDGDNGELGRCHYLINHPIIDFLKMGYLSYENGVVDFVVPKSKRGRKQSGVLVVVLSFMIHEEKDKLETKIEVEDVKGRNGYSPKPGLVTHEVSLDNIII